jgi:hypothetical protein
VEAPQTFTTPEVSLSWRLRFQFLAAKTPGPPDFETIPGVFLSLPFAVVNLTADYVEPIEWTLPILVLVVEYPQVSLY